MPDPLARVVAAALAAADPTPDVDLLHRFAESRDPAAFELLVRRHADLVWRVCRGVLRGDRHRAEDAFQATFLALARKASTVRGSTAGWLFRVARHAALKARAKAARFPGPLPDELPGVERADPTEAAEVSAAVAEEVDRLPARLRDPVVLCLLQGLTHAEAASRLGWAVGTVASRLSRARDRLRGRLERRGVAGAALTAAGGSAPGSLVRSTAAVGAGATPTRAVVSLTNGALTAMSVPKLKWAIAAVMLGLAGGGSLWAVGHGDAPKADPPPKAAEAKPAAKPARRVADAASRAKTREKLFEIAGAIGSYYMDRGHLPTDILDPAGKPLLSWRVAILPYMEQRALHSTIKLDEPWDSPTNLKWITGIVVKPFAPLDGTGFDADGRAVTYVKRPTGPGTLHQPGREITVSREQATAKWGTVVALIEAGDAIPWTKPGDLPFDPRNPPTLTGPAANVVLAETLFHAYHDRPHGWSLRPDLTPDEVARLVTADDPLTADEFRAYTLNVTPADADYVQAAADLRAATGMLEQVQTLAAAVAAEDAKRPGAPRADRAAAVGNRTVAVANMIQDLFTEVGTNPALKAREDLQKDFEKLLGDAKRWRDEREKRAAP